MTDYTVMEDGDLLNELGDDAGKWAAAFMQIVEKRKIDIDEGFMITWFANAIERSHDVKVRREREILGMAPFQ